MGRDSTPHMTGTDVAAKTNARNTNGRMYWRRRLASGSAARAHDTAKDPPESTGVGSAGSTGDAKSESGMVRTGVSGSSVRRAKDRERGASDVDPARVRPQRCRGESALVRWADPVGLGLRAAASAMLFIVVVECCSTPLTQHTKRRRHARRIPP